MEETVRCGVRLCLVDARGELPSHCFTGYGDLDMHRYSITYTPFLSTQWTIALNIAFCSSS